VKRTDTHLKIKAAMTERRPYTTKEIAQITGIAEEGVNACLRGMRNRREVRVTNPDVRGEPFAYQTTQRGQP